MATFYSIVYANVRPSVGERVTIALIVRDESQLLFHYAPRKLDVLRRLLPAEAISLLQTCLTNLNTYIVNPEPVNALNHGQLFPDSSGVSVPGERLFEQDYVSYLARYNNNLLTFSQPVPIDTPVTELLYRNLFVKYIFADWEPVTYDLNHIKQVVKIDLQTDPDAVDVDTNPDEESDKLKNIISTSNSQKLTEKRLLAA